MGSGGEEQAPLGEGTIAVRGGLIDGDQGTPFLAGPTFAAPFHVRGDDPLEVAAYVYGRYGNPTWDALERALSEIEAPQSQTVLFPSGSAAITAVLMATPGSERAVVVPSDGYSAVREVTERLMEFGVEARAVPTDTEAVLDAIPGAALVLLESPSNPGLDLVDIEVLAEAADSAGARLVIDNTVATPLGQRPIELGAHGSLMSGSKHLTGHNDLLLGSFTSRDGYWIDLLRSWRRASGAIPGPFEAWLAHRSLPTLKVRIDRQCETALELAQALADREDVLNVRYPGLPDDPMNQLASRQMANFGSVICFDLSDRTRACRFLEGCELVSEATSFGGVHSTAERRARWGVDAVGEGLIRLSVGIEDAVDLRNDITRALDGSSY